MSKSIVIVIAVAENSDVEEFIRCVESVKAQSYKGPLRHVLVNDGPKGCARGEFAVTLPTATGNDGYNGHLIYAASPFIFAKDDEYLCFLDSDNYFREDHVEKMVEAVERGGEGILWAHSLRAIVDGSGKEVCRDNCESLGLLSHTCLSVDDRLIDLNCFMMHVSLARLLAPHMAVRARQPGVMEIDRKLGHILLKYGCGVVSRNYSVFYKVGNRADSVSGEFFLTHNETMHPGRQVDLETKPPLYVFHFNSIATSEALKDPNALDPLGEYEPCLLMGLHEKYTLFNGYCNMATLPVGALVYCSLCHPQSLPLDLLRSRPDLQKICYAIEGPNRMHWQQYTKSFLEAHFDVVLTYYKPLLEANNDSKTRYIECMYPGRFDLDLASHKAVLRENQDDSLRSVGIVLARRDGAGLYEIDGVKLHCLDFLREKYVMQMRGVTVYGSGWYDLKQEKPESSFILGGIAGKGNDTIHSIDHLANHTFALIIENTDAENYVSEKIFDALTAGCVPLYYGGDVSSVVPDDCFIDAKQFEDGVELQKYLDSFSDEKILKMKRNVMEKREAILEKVGLKEITRKIIEVLRI